MKKISLFIGTLFIGAALSASGCGKKADEAKKDDKKEEKKDDKKGDKMDGDKKDEKKDEAKKDDGGGAKTGIADCDALIDAYAALAKCDKLPQASRDAMSGGLETMKKGWGDLSKADDATKKAIGDGCKQGIDGVKQSMSAVGC